MSLPYNCITETDLRAGGAAAPNELLREWCSTLGPPCDLGAIWNPDLDPYPLDLAPAPGVVDDPESGILTDPSKRVVFYEVTNPTTPNSIRCVKNRSEQTVTIYY
jgi:hypothetical protein